MTTHHPISPVGEPIADEDLYSREPDRARRHLASLSPARRAQLHREWSDTPEEM